MPRLDSQKRARLPSHAFAYVDSRGRRRLPIHDESHVRNALARFNQVAFEDDRKRERARRRLLTAAKKYGIVPVGFITGQLQAERTHATAGRLVIELGQNAAPGELEQRLQRVLRDPTLIVLYWSDAARTYVDGTGTPISLPRGRSGRVVTYLRRGGRRLAAIVHAPAVLDDPELAQTVLTAVRFVVERDRHYEQVRATATAASSLPVGFVTLLMTDIESSSALLHRLGDRYGELLGATRRILRTAVSRHRGREIDARADEFFAVFEDAGRAATAAVAAQRALLKRSWPGGVAVRVRIGIHSGRPTLAQAGYIGLAVHTVARVCTAAHGGQIVVSGETRVALERSRPGKMRFRALGRHRLPGLPNPIALFQLDADGLPGRFPAPRISRGFRRRRKPPEEVPPPAARPGMTQLPLGLDRGPAPHGWRRETQAKGDDT